MAHVDAEVAGELARAHVGVGDPRITVAIPTRNRAELLRMAIRSVLEQDFTQLEILVSDNASTDGTSEVVRGFDDPRISYLPLQDNIGLHGNLSRCLGLGTAPYVTILQDDDYMLPGNLASKVAALDREPTAVLAHSRFHYVDLDGRVLQPDVEWRGRRADALEGGRLFVKRSLQEICRVNLTSAVLRRDRIGGLRFLEADGAQTDVGMWLRVGLRGDVVFVAETGTVRRVHTGALSFSSGALSRTDDSARVTIELVESAVAAQRHFLEESKDELGEAAARSLRRLHQAFYERKVVQVLLANVDDHTVGENLAAFLTRLPKAPGMAMLPASAQFIFMSLVGARGRSRLRAVKQKVGTRA